MITVLVNNDGLTSLGWRMRVIQRTIRQRREGNPHPFIQVATKVLLKVLDILHADVLQVVCSRTQTNRLGNGRRPRLKPGGRGRVCAVVQVHMLRQAAPQVRPPMHLLRTDVSQQPQASV